ncbi:MAG: thiamine diphosphokinase [Gemmatimonadales bacterium]|nr:thiamine diphosphokinase [Gemmatimonadales bacterium]
MSEYDIEKGGASCPIFPKQGPRAVVLCNGPPPSDSLLHYWLDGADIFVCTDAAGHPYDHLPRIPEIVIGDFDSLAGRILDGRDGPRFLQVDDQFTSDSEKALLFLAERGIGEVVMMGAMGWRLDHTLHNCHLLERFSSQVRICIVGHNADIVRLGPESPVSWDLVPGTRFSLLPLSGEVTGVTLDGAMYPLLGDTLNLMGPAAISNRVTMSPLLISVGTGSLLVTVDREFGPEYADDSPSD